jgi:hypothetical protein
MRNQPLYSLALAAGALALTLGLGGFQPAAADDLTGARTATIRNVRLELYPIP